VPQPAWPSHRPTGLAASPAGANPQPAGGARSRPRGAVVSAFVAEPYQSLYRRFRPQKFSEVRGQDHVTRALRNSARDATVHHAYLFSGPRGTGKTSTARILAKALNCTDGSDGEPCGVCDSCVAVTAGTSLDVHELDAASNNGVEAMRDLVARAALGTPGRWKVYIVDEVHMLSAAASNALLKTLEEPPGHVVFVLATTDPQKVLPTIRSRTQHFEFRLLGGELLSGLLRDVSSTAGLELPDQAIDLAVRRGHGSARDALSVLDQVAAAGSVEEETEALDQLVEGIVERDAALVLSAVAEAHSKGRDPQRLATDLLEQLRNGFLATMAPELVGLPDEARQHLAEQARRLGTAALVRAMEVVGAALVDMRDALDPRVCLEVALVRLARPEADSSPEALVERIERLERRLAGEAPPAAPVARPAAPTRAAEPPAPEAPVDQAGSGEAPPSGDRPAAGARAALGAVRKQSGESRPPGGPSPRPGRPPAPPKAPPAPTSAPPSAAAPAGGGQLPGRDELVQAWGDAVLASLKGRAKALYRVGRFVEVEDGTAVFALPNEPHRKFSEEVRPDVEAALSSHFGVRVPLRLVVEDGPGSGSGEVTPDDHVDIADLTDAPVDGPATPEERLREAFPGASWEAEA